jgi:hypothetical protein
MEPERPIEKLLRDAGKQRASGRNVELHPATRRMLHGEVTRHFGKSQTAPRSGSFFNSITHSWLRFGWSFGILLGLAVAALLMIPREQRPEGMTLAQSKTSFDRPGTGRDGVTGNRPADARRTAESKPMLEPTESSKVSVASGEANTAQSGSARAKPTFDLNGAGGGGARTSPASPALAGSGALNKEQNGRSRSVSQPTTPASPPLAQPQQNSSAVTLADAATRNAGTEPARPGGAPPSSQPALTFGGPLPSREIGGYANVPSSTSTAVPSAVAPAATNVPSLAARAPSIARNDAVYFDRTTTAIASDQSNAAVSQRFKSELAQDEKKAADKDTLKPAVLASFSFELTGTDVRVVDADGSVYSGTIEQQATAEADLLKEAAPSKAKSLDLAQETRRAESPPTGAVAAKPARDSATYSFHVTGTNRTLSAKVDFSGSVIGITNRVSPSENELTVNGPVTNHGFGVTAFGQGLGLQRARISGTAIVDEKRKLDVEATATRQ